MPIARIQTDTTRWQHALRTAICDPADLLSALQLDPALLDPALRAAARFALKVPRGYVARMRKGDPDDPLLRQVLPLRQELELGDAVAFVSDPVGDLASIGAPGVLQKYRGRALLIATGACAIHCRYCFRREFPYADNLAAAADWHDALGQLRADESVREVILSGGDPLALADHKLQSLTDALAQIPHIARLRIHSRLPVVLPERVDAGLLAWLATVRQRVALVIHANHANELDSAVADALARLADARISLLNQSVLLRGVNDSVTALADLSERLFELRVLPYYLHLLDRVTGAEHFDVDAATAGELMRAVAARLPGYLVPRLVREEAGMAHKTPIAW